MGANTFWNFQRQEGVKTWKPSVVGYGYFLELSISENNFLEIMTQIISGLTCSIKLQALENLRGLNYQLDILQLCACTYQFLSKVSSLIQETINGILLVFSGI